MENKENIEALLNNDVIFFRSSDETRIIKTSKMCSLLNKIRENEGIDVIKFICENKFIPGYTSDNKNYYWLDAKSYQLISSRDLYNKFKNGK